MDYFFSLLSQLTFGLTFIDVIILLVIAFYAYEGYQVGFVTAFFDLVSFVASFVIALKSYSILGGIISSQFVFPPGFSNAIAFFIIAFLVEIIANILLRIVFRKSILEFSRDNLAVRLQKQNHYLGIIPGIFSSLIILAFLLTVIISLPSSPVLKKQVVASHLGSILVANTASVEKALSGVFGEALTETLSFLTIKPESDETISLQFTVASPSVDEGSENEMLRMVNRERSKEGLAPVTMDGTLQNLARKYSGDMLVRGYFSHYNPERESPFDRMENEGISYLHAGENLALAPSVGLAMQGLMDSKGHRANILSPQFHKIGIGVMDGGIYGKMFTQEFTD